jgi:death-on-curing protein
MSHDFPTPPEVIAMHARLIETFGGMPGLRDPGALEAALMRPQLGYYQNLIEEAAALMESLANNHPFLDGNKWVAFFVTDTFLRMNGHYIECDNETAYTDFMQLFEARAFHFDRLEKWLREHVRASPASGFGQ